MEQKHKPEPYPVFTDGVIKSKLITTQQAGGHQGTDAFSLFKESVAKMGIASRKEIENWFTAETLGVSG